MFAKESQTPNRKVREIFIESFSSVKIKLLDKIVKQGNT